MLSDEQLLQYSRQIMLPQIDIEGQNKLLNARVLVLGLGGLGSPVAMYLATAGVGSLTLVDDDQVDLTNLQRQVIHRIDSIEKPKVDSAAETLKALAPTCRLQCFNERMAESDLSKLVSQVDLVVDCCDNFETRFMINRVCFSNKTPLVSGAAIRWEGQVSTFTMQANTPCYRCVYEEDVHSDQSCAHNGVVAPLVGVIGSMQALEAVKVITGAGEPASGKLLLFDGLSMEWRTIKFKPRKGCPVCGDHLR
ncbi:molybdopterin-synthase adenylyltransferase MoeB [Aliikangiella marina]|uniref:Molybdopterin-synthase adenylyltransferase n=2 Tax=Aliikangiella marina TaxID=1712262 RepID=A0A545TJY6_9GAMM|nr:molybdopterin-synthase adenylyltransferase MoeB [Aliikangiella marina]